MKLRTLCAALLLALILLGGLRSWTPTSDRPAYGPPVRNLVLVIGDGMGAGHIQATGVLLHGRPGSLTFESLPHQALVITDSVGGEVTDSAAAATALATGHKVSNGVLSVGIPGDGGPLTTVLELALARGRKVGLVTTAFLDDATPAAFGAHAARRDDGAAIAEGYFKHSRPHVLFGGGTKGCNQEAARAAGYTLVTDRAGLQALAPGERFAGIFGSGPMPYEYDGDYAVLPHLSEMTRAALGILEGSPEGFFLLVENENIDSAGHENHLERTTAAVAELDRAVQALLEWAKNRQDTLILVTADHETGGLSIDPEAGVRWSTKSHTRALVPAYATGPGAEAVEGTLDNTQLYHIMEAALAPPGRPGGQNAL